MTPTARDAVMEKSPKPATTSTLHSAKHKTNETVDQVLQAVIHVALRCGIDKQNSALEDWFSKLSKCCRVKNALESKWHGCRYFQMVVSQIRLQSLKMSILVLFQFLCYQAHTASFLNNKRSHVPSPQLTMVQLLGKFIRPSSTS